MYTVAVRELCEFTAKQGDLDLRFTPAPTALEGMLGHAAVAARRGHDFETEIPLSASFENELTVRGRADGFDPDKRRLEEVKTFKGRLERQAPSHRALHWAQAKLYGWLMCLERGYESLDVALVYFNIASQQETVFSEHCAAEQLREHFEQHCRRFLSWARRQLAHREQRDAALAALTFPFGDFRTGQRELAEAVYRAAAGRRCLLAQAPTGIGKTLGTLFPLLKAMPTQQLDRIFFLAAKTSGRQMAMQSLGRLDAAAPLRVMELVARDKACEHPDLACHGDSCPLARGFYDRLPAAREAALAMPGPLTQQALRAAALAHEVCPYYLSQELARWVDVVVGDYNYYFDLGGLLHGLMQANQWRVGVLVDEAHNLVERARGMYSAELQPATLAEALRAARKLPTIKRALDKVRRAWIALDKAQDAPYAVHESPPEALMAALQQAASALAEHLADAPNEPDPALQNLLFEALHLARMAESLDTHSLVDLTKGDKAGSSTLCLRNLVPAPFLKPRLEAAHTSTLFSATLQPNAYYVDLLGLPERHVCVDVESPFRAEQLAVNIARNISTRFADRSASLAPIAELMAAQFRARPGNYLAFFSSYDYLQQVADMFAALHPALPAWRQSRRMGEAEQQLFLGRFTESGQGIGFAVLGGAFSEGIDLPGRRLIGAFLSTLGLPQVNPVNEQVKIRMARLFGNGAAYDYTYLYPGLQKVVQAAGRVIRTPSDEGVVHLIDDRFARREVHRLLPRWWALTK